MLTEVTHLKFLVLCWIIVVLESLEELEKFYNQPYPRKSDKIIINQGDEVQNVINAKLKPSSLDPGRGWLVLTLVFYYTGFVYSIIIIFLNN